MELEYPLFLAEQMANDVASAETRAGELAEPFTEDDLMLLVRFLLRDN